MDMFFFSPPRGNFEDDDFHIAQCLTCVLKHVSLLTSVTYACNILLYMLPIKNRSNDIESLKSKPVLKAIQRNKILAFLYSPIKKQ